MQGTNFIVKLNMEEGFPKIGFASCTFVFVRMSLKVNAESAKFRANITRLSMKRISLPAILSLLRIANGTSPSLADLAE